MAEWSKALVLGTSPKGREFEPHFVYLLTVSVKIMEFPMSLRMCHCYTSTQNITMPHDVVCCTKEAGACTTSFR